ncbi:hypothetical protein BCR44DRAFT_1250066 [Catenaria anguillulae PL171]|uniref:Uncharacterized protein n=1 Tax=Catenaria anguillulae PL171 TaxID=765915 RepID=A0A1Y2HY74_9FUNG|nr:hypothetical protein BCR44DRAFT_1250066 [Catenaria anguillulae PL171]
MIPVYVEAMKAADANQPSAAQVWTTIRPLLVSALPGTEHPFMFGLKLICHAMFAEVPQEVWIDLLEPIRKLAAPPNAFRSMPNTLTEAAKNAQVWHAIHDTVVKSLRVSLAENKPLNVYPKVTPHLLMFKLTLSLAVGARRPTSKRPSWLS